MAAAAWCRPDSSDLAAQARQMGLYAARGLAGGGDALGVGLTFELFSHVTRFAGLKVVLLGLYNGQKLDAEPEADLVSYSRAVEARSPPKPNANSKPKLTYLLAYQ